MTGSVVERLARASLVGVLRADSFGPCQVEGCPDAATVVIGWQIAAFGTTVAWYCDDHAPEEAIEGNA